MARTTISLTLIKKQEPSLPPAVEKIICGLVSRFANKLNIWVAIKFQRTKPKKGCSLIHGKHGKKFCAGDLPTLELPAGSRPSTSHVSNGCFQASWRLMRGFNKDDTELLVGGGTGTAAYSLGVMGHYAKAQITWRHGIPRYETF